MNKRSGDLNMELGEHLDELRRRVIVTLSALVLFSVVAFMFKGALVEIVFAPSHSDFLLNRWMLMLSERFGLPELAINQRGLELINTSMAGQFNLHIKTSVFAGFVCAFPFALWQLWGFVAPALSVEVQRQCRWITLQVTLFFFAGLAFGYLFISPLAINFLAGYTFSQEIQNLIEVPSYLSTVINISLAASMIFQLPHLLYLLARMGVVTAESMRRGRRLAIVVIVIVSAIITPPDVFSQLLIALPFYLLYEYGIGVVAREERRNLK